MEADKLKRQIEIDTLSKQIIPLWEQLEVPIDERKAFSKTVNGYSKEVINHVSISWLDHGACTQNTDAFLKCCVVSFGIAPLFGAQTDQVGVLDQEGVHLLVFF